MNPELKNLDTPTLVDLLARTTQRYTQLFSEKRFDQEYIECKNMMEIIMKEIESRAPTKNPDTQAGVGETS